MLTQNLPTGEHLEFMEVLGELTNGHHKSPHGSLDEWEEWQSRPLDAVYPVIFIDSLTVKTREGSVPSRPFYLVIGLDCEGFRHVLGIWPGTGSGEARDFWSTLLGELTARGVADVCIVCCDKTSGLPEAVTAVFPRAVVQLSVIRLIRACLRHATKRDLRTLSKSLRDIHSAADEPAATAAFETFAEDWDSRYPATVKLWRSHWPDFVRLWQLPPEIRRVIHTTNQIEVTNEALRKAVRQRGYFATTEAALAALYLTLREARLDVIAKVPNWKPALQAFAVHFDGRLPAP